MKYKLHLNTTNSNFQCNHNKCPGDDCCSDMEIDAILQNR
jgi:hypothetical protein